MTANIEILFLRDSTKNHSHMTLARFLRFQSYLVPIGRECNHIWSVSEFTLQSYLVLFVKKIAIIIDPHHNNYCNHIWSIHILGLLPLNHYFQHDKVTSRIEHSNGIEFIDNDMTFKVFICLFVFIYFVNQL